MMQSLNLKNQAWYNDRIWESMMKPLRSEELLRVWETGLDKPPVQQALYLLSVACSVPELETIADWSIGQRDAYLFRFREQMFGTSFVNTASCPNCQEQVEWNMDMEEFPIPKLNGAAAPQLYDLKQVPYHIQFRLPNSRDLMTGNPQLMLANCLLKIEKGMEQVAFEKLPESVLKALDREMEKVSPLGNLTILLNCPSCENHWEILFDIVNYLWTEIDVWAKHLLQEVYLLARAFGWSERDVLNLSNKRRQIYLEMVRS